MDKDCEIGRQLIGNGGVGIKLTCNNTAWLACCERAGKGSAAHVWWRKYKQTVWLAGWPLQLPTSGGFPLWNWEEFRINLLANTCLKLDPSLNLLVLKSLSLSLPLFHFSLVRDRE